MIRLAVSREPQDAVRYPGASLLPERTKGTKIGKEQLREAREAQKRREARGEGWGEA